MDVDELAKKYSSGGTIATTSTAKPATASAGAVDVDTLAKKYSSVPTTEQLSEPTAEKNFGENALGGFKQGLMDVINAPGKYVYGPLDEAVTSLWKSDSGKKRRESFDARVDQENKDFEKNFGESSVAEYSRLGGQIVGTAPLAEATIPLKIAQAGNAAITGVRTLGTKLGAISAAGAIGGGEFGALTSTANDKGFVQNTGEGIITGALAAAPLHYAAKAISKAVGSAWDNINISKLATSAGMIPSAVKNIVQRLADAGFTPQTAQAELNKMGPKATLADLDASLTTEASGLASRGGKETAILKNRFNDRAETADSSANKIIDTQLGPKPDFKAEKEAIISAAQKGTKKDYDLAHNSGDQLDISHVVDSIDKQLETAVGPKKKALLLLKSYLFKETKDAAGNVTKELKSEIPHLHEVRQGIDDVLEKATAPTTTAGKHTIRAISDVRKAVDAELKTNSEMAAADTKFAEKMKINDALDLGKTILTKMSREEFGRVWAGATTEIKEAIRKGARVAIGDALDLAQKGELSAAQRLFAKKSLNREKLKLIFGNKGELALDELAKEGSFRATEKAVSAGSQTAERQAVQARYGLNGEGSGFVKDALKAAALDITTGSPAVATGLNATRAIASGGKLHMRKVMSNSMAEGSADLLSRNLSTKEFDMMDKVSQIQNRVRTSNPLKIPVSMKATGPLAITVYRKQQ